MRLIRFLFIAVMLYFVFLNLAVNQPVTHWLGDQVDQNQAAIRLFQGHLKFLYGPFMSGTNPPVHTIGLFGPVMFASGVLFGGTPELAQVVLAMVLSGALALFLGAIWDQKGLVSAVSAATLVLASRSFWWTFHIYWEPLLILAWSLCYAAVFVQTVPRWRAGYIWIHLAMFLLGLQVHAVFLVLLPVLVFALTLNHGYWRRSFFALRRERGPKILMAAAILPYVIAEAVFKLRNTKAIIAHLKQKAAVGNDAGWRAFARVVDFYHLELKTDIGLARWGGEGLTAFWILIAVVSAAGLFRFFWRKNKTWTNVCLFFMPLMMLWHGLFFLKMNRDIQGEHYLALGLPFLVLWILCVFHEARHFSRVVSLIVTLAVTWHLWSEVIPNASKTVEQTPWTWQAIQSGLKTLCGKYGTEGFRTFEGPGFLTYSEELDPVLRFTLKRWDFGCRYNETSNLALRPEISGQLPVDFVDDNQTWALVESVTPGIGLYRLKVESL